MDETAKPQNGQPTEEAPDQITITLTSRKPWKITIGGTVESMNLALAMLADATREMETEWRIARGIAASMKHKQEQEDAQRVGSLLNTRFPRGH